MKITTTKNSLRDESNKEIKAVYYLIIDNEQGQTLKINVGQKTYEGVQKLNEPTLKK